MESKYSDRSSKFLWDQPSTVFRAFCYFILRQQLVKEKKKDLHKKGKDACK